jgi:hypothetical protein
MDARASAAFSSASGGRSLPEAEEKKRTLDNRLRGEQKGDAKKE